MRQHELMMSEPKDNCSPYRNMYRDLKNIKPKEPSPMFTSTPSNMVGVRSYGNLTPSHQVRRHHLYGRPSCDTSGDRRKCYK